MAAEMLHILMGAERGGCELDCLMIVSYLKAMPHRVLLLKEGGPMVADFELAGAAVDRFAPEQIRSSARFCRSLEQYAAKHQPRVVMIWHGLVWLPPILYALRDCPAQVGVHGGNPAHTMKRWVDWKFRLLGLRYAVCSQPIYICCSQYVADSFDTSGYLRQFRRVVVPNGVQLPLFTLRPSRAVGPEDEFTIGMLARLDKIKDHATLLRAFALLRNDRPKCRLELVGSGAAEPELRALANDLGISAAVRFLGQVSDVYSVMAGWDLFAYATTEAEGLGNSLAEAMMLGLPCVATEVGPIRELAGEGNAVELVAPGDPAALAKSLSRMAGDVNLRRALGERGRMRAESNFHPNVFAQRYAKVFGLDAMSRV